MKGQILHQWEIEEGHQAHRTTRWYLIAGIVAAGFLTWALLTLNFLFALIIVLAYLIYVADHLRGHHICQFTITANGIAIDDNFYDYREINDFFIIYQPPEVKSLYFDFKSRLKPKLLINLEDQNPVEIRHSLLTYLSEDLEHEEELFSDALSRMLKL